MIIKEFRFYQNTRSPRLPELNVYGYVKDDLGNTLGNASVIVESHIDQASATTDSKGRYAVALSVNSPGDRIRVTATFDSRSGSAFGAVPSRSSSMRIDAIVPGTLTGIFDSLFQSTGLMLGVAIGILIIRMRKKAKQKLDSILKTY
ncbi:MAG: carboxypeptidase-like regulatory domain-containing protein [Thermoproteota archaeon]